MKKQYLFVFLLGWSVTARATHLLGGEIQAKHITGLTYDITTVLYLDVQNGQAATDAQAEITLCLGDGKQVVVRRVSSEVLSDNPAVTRSLYRFQHTYAAPGVYTILSSLEKFTNDLLNVPPPPQEQAMVIQVVLNTTVPNTTAPVPSPRFTSGIRQVFSLPLATSDPDGDSLSYRIVKILRSPSDCGPARPHDSYIFPNEVSREGIFRIDRATSALIWNAPVRVGTYTYAYVTEEWRQGAKVAEVWRTNSLYITDQNGAVTPIPPFEPVQLFEIGLVTALPVQEFLPGRMSLRVYPVPSEDWIKVQVESRKPAAVLIELIDSQGRVVQKADVLHPATRQVQEMNVQNLPRGIYFIRASSTEGNITQKIIR